VTVVDGVRLVSNSEVQTHKDCPRKWWLAWYRGLTPRRRQVVGARSTGTRIHISLAELYKPGGTHVLAIAGLLAAQIADREELELQHGRIAFSEDPSSASAEIMDKQWKDLNGAFDLEQAMIEGYLQWSEETGVDSQLEVISAEQKIEVDFPAKLRFPVKLIAKLDARVRSTVTSAIKYIDHKTVGSLHDMTLGINQQMLHYHVMDDLLTKQGEPRPEGALYNMLRKVKRTRAAKPPFYTRIPIDHNRYELDGYKRQLHGVIARIEQAETELEDTHGSPSAHQWIVPPRPSRDCTWKCDFFKICRMFDDGSRVEAAIEEHYTAGDPLAYYGDREESGESS
jgi:hypothetical protein